MFEQFASAGVANWQVQLTVAMGNAADNHALLLQPYELRTLYPELAELFEKWEKLDDETKGRLLGEFLGNNPDLLATFLTGGAAAVVTTAKLATKGLKALKATGRLAKGMKIGTLKEIGEKLGLTRERQWTTTLGTFVAYVREGPLGERYPRRVSAQRRAPLF